MQHVSTGNETTALQSLDGKLADVSDQGEDSDGLDSRRATAELTTLSMYQKLDMGKVIGRGTFGTVFKGKVAENGEIVAIKKVLQDPSFKNRELTTLQMLQNVRKHPNVVQLKHHFYRSEIAHGESDEYLYLVMEYVQGDLSRLIKHYSKTSRVVPPCYTKLYMYQLARGLLYMHAQNVCHRDLKPSNVLFDPGTNRVKICDLGSAKVLREGEKHVSYIASRWYRAPELIFDSCHYSYGIDMWAYACIVAEMLLGEPLFPGQTSKDQLVEIVNLIGTPTNADLLAMNPEIGKLNYRAVKPIEMRKVFDSPISLEAVHMLEGLFIYDPQKRLDALGTMASSFFDDLRSLDFVLPNNGYMPPLFDFHPEEIKVDKDKVKALIPACYDELVRRRIGPYPT